MITAQPNFLFTPFNIAQRCSHANMFIMGYCVMR
jgi:hypothetical protein